MIFQPIHSIYPLFIADFKAMFAGLSNGQTSATTKAVADHCGSGFTEAFVPEQRFGCKMAQACKAHDICYGACDPGASKQGSDDYCKRSEFSAERVATKQACDTQFWSTWVPWKLVVDGKLISTSGAFSGFGVNP